MIHEIETDLNFCRYGYSLPSVGDAEVAAAKATIQAYHSATMETREDNKSRIWAGIVATHQRELVDLTRRADARALATYLAELGRTEAGHGFYLGKISFDEIIVNRDYCTMDLGRHLDCLIHFGEAVGCLRVLPKTDHNSDPRLRDGAEPVIAAIERVTGLDLMPPDVLGGAGGIITDRGILHMRHLNAAYAAWRIKGICARSSLNDQPVICEIGAGAGYVAYYLAKSGISDITLIDLVSLNVIQGYFLRLALGEDRVQLYKPGPTYHNTGKVRVLPPECFRDAPSAHFDLVLNQDSFPEIDPDAARQYLEDGKRSIKSHILSINQEHMGARDDQGSFTTFSEHAWSVGGLSRLYRVPYWMRENYVEELWEIDTPVSG